MRFWVRRPSEDQIHELFIKEELPAKPTDVDVGYECDPCAEV